jgi:hypothetical protein
LGEWSIQLRRLYCKIIVSLSKRRVEKHDGGKMRGWKNRGVENHEGGKMRGWKNARVEKHKGGK